MTDKPIIFSAPMVRALLDGRKTQTRRVLKPQPPESPDPRCAPSNTPRHAAPYLDAYCGEKRTSANPRGMSRNWHWWQVDDRPGVCVTRAPCAPGDRLWVRERFAISGIGWGKKPKDAIGGKVHYFADPENGWFHYWGSGHPSIHMPRWASRLTLTVTDVRVQRLQQISEADAKAEGLEWVSPTYGVKGLANSWSGDPRHAFSTLWNSLHGHDAWIANPWVVALTFGVHRGNIDTMGGGS